MKIKFSALLIIVTFGLTPAWAGLHYGLGAAVAKQGAKAIETAEATAAASRLPACAADPFSVSPLSTGLNFNIETLGHLAPYGHTLPTEHIYFIIVKSTDDTTAHDVYAPADLRISQIVRSETLLGDPVFDYSLYYGICDGMDGYLHHIKTLSASLLSQAGPLDQNCSLSQGNAIRNCSANVTINVQAGDVIGTVVGSTGSSLVGLDFGTHDLRAPALTFANPSRRSIYQLHTVCGVDYFGGSLQANLESRLGAFDGSTRRTAAPLCGEYNQDVAGTAQGNWYLDGTPAGSQQDEFDELALVHDNVDSSTGVFSVGRAVTASNLPASVYRFAPTSSGLVNRDFDDVTANGNVYCYDSFTNFIAPDVILIQMTSATTLKIEYQSSLSGCGVASWSLTSNATTFIR